MHRTLLSLPVLFLLISGCAGHTKTHFTSIPVDDAVFAKKQEDLRAEYPDIGKFDGPYAQGFFTTIKDMPPMDELLTAWGEPASKRVSGWNVLRAAAGAGAFSASVFSPAWMIGGAVFFTASHPMSVWTWNKGNYEIDCVVDYPAAFKYKPHLYYWRWYAREQSESGKSPSVSLNE